jgi:aryl-alcohol dehydrogenase-like predicted oxidoreductase
MQNHYSLLYREEEREMNKFCKISGVGLLPWGPLNAGRLARPLKDQDTVRAQKQDIMPQDAAIIDRVEEIAEKKGRKMSQVALAWINERVSSPISGFSSIARMDEGLAANTVKLTTEEEKYLEDLYYPKPKIILSGELLSLQFPFARRWPVGCRNSWLSSRKSMYKKAKILWSVMVSLFMEK